MASLGCLVTLGYLTMLVYDNARVFGDALVYDNACVSDNAWVYGNALVYSDSWVSGNIHVDSVNAIIVLCIAMKHSVTVTRKHVQIGCRLFKRSKILKFSKKNAAKRGIPEELYDGYKQMIRGAMKLVKSDP